MKTEIKFTATKHPFKKGYAIRHNQPIGFYGTTQGTFGWYKYKSDAIKRSNELQKCYK